MDMRLDMERLTSLQGSEVYGSDGEKIGKIEEIYFDEATRQPEWIGVGTGFLRMHRVVVPVAGATQDGEVLRVPYSKDQVKDSPAVNEDEISTATEQELAAYYGLGYSFEESESGLPEMAASGPVDVEASMQTATPMKVSAETADSMGSESPTPTEAEVGQFTREPYEGEATPVTTTAEVSGGLAAGTTGIASGTRLSRWTPSTGTTTTTQGTTTTTSDTAAATYAPPATSGESYAATGSPSSMGEVSADWIESMRGKDLYGSDGEKIGAIDEVYVDDATSQPEWLGIDTGFLGMKRVVVPFRAVAPHEDGFVVSSTKDQVKDSPSVDVDEISVEDERELCAYYGLEYSHAESPTGMPAGGTTESGVAGSRHRRWWGAEAA